MLSSVVLAHGDGSMPRGLLVAEGVVAQALMENADESVRDGTEGLVSGGAAGSEGVVVGPRPVMRSARRMPGGVRRHRVGVPGVLGYDDLFVPEARVIGLISE